MGRGLMTGRGIPGRLRWLPRRWRSVGCLSAPNGVYERRAARGHHVTSMRLTTCLQYTLLDATTTSGCIGTRTARAFKRPNKVWLWVFAEISRSSNSTTQRERGCAGGACAGLAGRRAQGQRPDNVEPTRCGLNAGEAKRVGEEAATGYRSCYRTGNRDGRRRWWWPPVMATESAAPKPAAAASAPTVAEAVTAFHGIRPKKTGTAREPSVKEIERIERKQLSPSPVRLASLRRCANQGRESTRELRTRELSKKAK
jgi:hypothetical protein